jgi:hypothetical protein
MIVPRDSEEPIDPVVATFMSRVAGLAPEHRESIDFFPREIVAALWWDWPKMAALYLGELVSAVRFLRLLRRSCPTALVHQPYQTFVNQLINDGWSFAGIGKVAGGIALLRLRQHASDSAASYDMVWGRVITRVAIGWYPPPSA